MKTEVTTSVNENSTSNLHCRWCDLFDSRHSQFVFQSLDSNGFSFKVNSIGPSVFSSIFFEEDRFDTRFELESPDFVSFFFQSLQGHKTVEQSSFDTLFHVAFEASEVPVLKGILDLDRDVGCSGVGIIDVLLRQTIVVEPFCLNKKTIEVMQSFVGKMGFVDFQDKHPASLRSMPFNGRLFCCNPIAHTIILTIVMKNPLRKNKNISYFSQNVCLTAGQALRLDEKTVDR